MRQEKLLLEEVTKIQLSYKIIKSDSVDCDEETTSVIHTKLDYKIREVFPTQGSNSIGYEPNIDLDVIRKELLEELLIETEEERLNIIELARQEALELQLVEKQKGFEQGLKEGYEQGYKDGVMDAETEAIIIKNNAIDLINQAHTYTSDYLVENHHNIIRLAADMAESIVHTVIDESSENVTRLIKPILQQFSKKENIIITCNPDNLAYIKCYKHELEESCPDAKFIILSDSNLERNGCVIENDNSIINLQIKEQLNSMIEDLNETINLE